MPRVRVFCKSKEVKKMTVAVIWILAQMEAPWWVVTCLVLAAAVKTVVGFCRFMIEYGERK